MRGGVREVIDDGGGVVSGSVVDDDAVGLDTGGERERGDAGESVAHERGAIMGGNRDCELEGHVVVRAARPRAP